MKYTRKNIFLFLFIFIGIACGETENKTAPVNTSQNVSSQITPQIDYTVTAYYPHSTDAFTEGLLFYNGLLYESTGSPDELPKSLSAIVSTNLTIGKTEVKTTLDRTKYFGEGMAFLNDKCYQLTYKNQLGFIYDANSFKKLGEFSYPNKEGWGMTTDSHFLIMSDGTATSLTLIL